jgi:hypothetical protein
LSSSGWDDISQADLALAALTMADTQEDGVLDGDNLVIGGVVAADKEGMTLEWVQYMWQVVADMQGEMDN